MVPTGFKNYWSHCESKKCQNERIASLCIFAGTVPFASAARDKWMGVLV